MILLSSHNMATSQLNPCNFFFWSFKKEQMYAKEVNNNDEFFMKINNVADINHQTRQMYWKNLEFIIITSSYGKLHRKLTGVRLVHNKQIL